MELHSEENDATISITLDRSTALVLDDMLARWLDSPDSFVLHLGHDAEWHALSHVLAKLEVQMPHLFSTDYSEQVALAQQEVVAQWGSLDWRSDDGKDSLDAP